MRAAYERLERSYCGQHGPGLREKIMSKTYLTCAETAKLLRAALKAAHPGVKFSVRSDTYAGGASIRVIWTDGPTGETVDRTAKQYQGATFDGMIDLKSYHSTLLADAAGDVIEVHFGADFVFVERSISGAFVQSLLPRVKRDAYDDHAGQCGQCGNWLPAGDRWNAHATHYVQDFTCSQHCAARRLARYTDAATVPA